MDQRVDMVTSAYIVMPHSRQAVTIILTPPLLLMHCLPPCTTLFQEPVDGADVSLLKTDVETILGDLTAREAYVLKMRFGLGGSSPSTLETVGRQLHVTRERVRQIQLAAIEKLRGRTPTHEVLYADRAASPGGKESAAATAAAAQAMEMARATARATARAEWGDQEQVGRLPSAVLIGLVKQALEPRQEEMLGSSGRVVNGARRRGRRRLVMEASQGERGLEVENGGGQEKGRGFVMKRPYTPRRPREDGGGVRDEGDVAGTQTQAHAVPAAPPPVMRTASWQPSLQAA